jgi:magnesium transporter
VAFCFYNLSSIINGLIYFDQFSLLSTAHLLLVVLGMAILLTGVWIVSFPPSGSHRIDLSAWNDNEESDMEDDEEHIRYEDEPLPMAGSPLDEEIGMGRVSSREHSPPRQPHLIDLSGDAHATPSNLHLVPPARRHPRRQTDSALLSTEYGAAPALHPAPPTPNSPTRSRQRLSVGTAHLSTLGPLSPRQSFAAHTLPLSPGAPSGFSIGLSPISPGFSLVPTERMQRRRRVTSLGSIDGVGDIFSTVHAKSLRRIVSENTQAGVGVSRGTEDAGVGDADVETQQYAQVHGAEGEPHERRKGARGRWKWLSGVMAFRRR